MKLTFHSDPGHGWLEVPKDVVRSLGKQVCDAISFYSYQDKDNLYLEEDDDAPLVMNSMKERGIQFEIVDKNWPNEAPCRNFKRVNV